MAFAGIKKPEDRADLLLYLRSISPDAPPLPEPEAETAAAGEQTAAAEQPAQEGAEEPAQDGGEQEVAAVQLEAEAASEPAAAAAGGEQGDFHALLAAADPAAGEKAAKKCAVCHSFEQGGAAKLGPPLWDVLGREIASAPDFRYSNALAEKDGSWDYDKLHAFLANPKEWAPGTKMAFAGVRKPEELADIIAYLRSLSDSPEPLPEGG
jgi:cytochrome c